jgi:hypothetical protein
MSSFYVRRAERHDVDAIVRLMTDANTEKTNWTSTLEKRYSKAAVQDIGRLMFALGFLSCFSFHS